jgi:hypothetical protein
VGRARQRHALSVAQSEAEREQVAATLRHHYAAGRLTVEEFTARIDRAYAAETPQELRAVLAGLSAPPLTVGGSRLGLVLRHEGFLVPAAVFGAIEAFLILVWALTGGGYFWPVWPFLGLALVLSFVAIGLFFGTSKDEVARRRELPRSDS